MAINLKSTGSLSASGVKLLVYGQAGAGKTSLIKSLPAPIVLSAEGGEHDGSPPRGLLLAWQRRS